MQKIKLFTFLLEYEILLCYYQLKTQYSDFTLHKKHL